MKTTLALFTLALILAGHRGTAQTHPPPVEDFKPSTLNQPGQQYPQVNSQRYAHFRIVAPQAQSVRVSLGLGGRGGTTLMKGEDGVWTGTTAGPLDEGFHYYHLTVDGGTFNDPGTLNFDGSTRWESGIEIPAHDQDFYALKDVPHGRVQQVLFPSKLTNSIVARPAYVYTPPDYDKDTTKRYPVLHMGGAETKIITLKNLDKFSRIGLFSGGTITTNDVNNTPGFREKVKVVFCSCGSRENASGIRSNREALNSIGLKNTGYVSEGTAHEFLTWRRSLREFAPLLFKD